MSHKSRQTITNTPWEQAEFMLDRSEIGQLRSNRIKAYRRKGIVRHPESYAAAAAFNEEHGLTTKRPYDKKLRFIHRHHRGRSRKPISLAKIKGSEP